IARIGCGPSAACASRTTSSSPTGRRRCSPRRSPPSATDEAPSMPAKQAPATISINRAPVMTLWAAVVAERLGFDRDEALTLGRAVAGLNAQSKGRRIGASRPHEEKAKKTGGRDYGEKVFGEVCGRDGPATVSPEGVRTD